MAVAKHAEQRVGVFVDIQNMYYSAKNLYQMRVNFGNILERAVSGRKLIRALAYVIKSNNPDEQGFFDALTGQGFSVKMKDLQVYYDGTKKESFETLAESLNAKGKLDSVVFTGGIFNKANINKLNNLMSVLKAAMKRVRGVETVDEFIDLSQEQEWFLMKAIKQPVRYLGRMIGRKGREEE